MFPSASKLFAGMNMGAHIAHDPKKKKKSAGIILEESEEGEMSPWREIRVGNDSHPGRLIHFKIMVELNNLVVNYVTIKVLLYNIR